MSYPNPLAIDAPTSCSMGRPANDSLRAPELCVLGSGSGGNCSVVRSPGGVLLLDAGLGPRTFGKRLAAVRHHGLPVTLDDVTAVCLTHLDSDHFNVNWFQTFERRDIAVWCHVSCAREVRARSQERGTTIAIHTFDCDEPFEPVPGLTARAVACAHDSTGSHGFRLDAHGGGSIGYATDLGHVPATLLDLFCDVDLLAIESNYDRQMQVDSPRPWFLKQRIMNGGGHLSNAEAYAAVRELFDRCDRAGRVGPRHVVLLHRSRECNCPDLLRKFFARDRRIGGRLTLSDQHEPTPWLRAGPAVGEQMMLAWG